MGELGGASQRRLFVAFILIRGAYAGRVEVNRHTNR